MKLKFYLNEKGEKVYTLKNSKQTKDAHYKFKSAPVFTRKKTPTKSK